MASPAAAIHSAADAESSPAGSGFSERRIASRAWSARSLVAPVKTWDPATATVTSVTTATLIGPGSSRDRIVARAVLSTVTARAGAGWMTRTAAQAVRTIPACYGIGYHRDPGR